MDLPFRILRAAYTLITLELILFTRELAHNALGMLARENDFYILQVSFLQKRASVLQEQLDASHIRRWGPGHAFTHTINPASCQLCIVYYICTCVLKCTGICALSQIWQVHKTPLCYLCPSLQYRNTVITDTQKDQPQFVFTGRLKIIQSKPVKPDAKMMHNSLIGACGVHRCFQSHFILRSNSRC